ncbi:MAG: DUF3987 domain-containing protein [Bacteroidetes bacterium]|nr:DUF3987 domain-containing protein [Bacteroidota bacterium]
MSENFNLAVSLEDLESRVKGGIFSGQGQGGVEVVEDVEDFSELIKICNFPIDVFPYKFQELVESTSVAFDVDVEAVVTAALSVLSGAIGNTIRISPKNSFYVSPFLWAAIVSPPGTAKTPLINALVNSIKIMQAEAYQEYMEEMNAYLVEINSFKKDKGKGKSSPPPKPPKMKQFYVSDSTIEALADVFEVAPRGVLNYQDELSGLIMGLDQYKGKGNDRQHYLDLFNSGSWKIDRKGGSRFIPNIGMSIVGGIQPMILSQVFGDSSFLDGFIHRFIFVCPDKKSLRFNRESMCGMEYWENLIEWCYRIPLEIKEDGFVNSKILTLNGDALDFWEKFYNEYGELASILPSKIAGFIPKLFLYSLKFAGIIHIVYGFNGDRIFSAINKETIEKAIRLTEYYFGQVAKVLKLYSREKESDGQKERVVNALQGLECEVSKGKLATSKIAEKYNERLPKHVHITSAKISSILRKQLQLETRLTGGYSFLLWEGEKINNLFKKTSTTSTTSTSQHKKDEVVEDVEDYSEKNLENIPKTSLERIEI